MYPLRSKRCSSSEEGWVMQAEQINYLKDFPYIYNACAGSVLELLFLQRFWIWLATFIPVWVSPCLITCVGLVINVVCCSLVLYFSPDIKEEAPCWVFLLCAFGIFLYQTFDALDGKQAIRVQNTQLEEYFDHGCDAISMVFVTLAISVALQLGSSPSLLFILFLVSILSFFSAHWQDHVTHVILFGKIDVSEAQITMMVIHLLTALFGQSFWHIKVGKLDLEICQVLVILSILLLCLIILSNVAIVLGRKTELDEFVVLPRKLGVEIWYPLVPVLTLTLLAVKGFSAGLFDAGPSIFIISFGFAFSKLTIKLVIVNVSKSDMDLWDSSLVGPILLSLNTFVCFLEPHTALLCTLVYNAIDFVKYFTYASWDLREALDVWIFSLKYPPGHPLCRNGNLGFYVNGLNNHELKEKHKMEEFLKALSGEIFHETSFGLKNGFKTKRQETSEKFYSINDD
ncbi:cholinephosphotransferase 1-like isoform X2 [Tachypleus tridentatus]|uniref:cholinephosphotransferase 1-like isoform X2 n=1 Tax=Tachypleus tridentatus TaxID=6853 RepID=UPI003FCF8960